VFILLKIVLIAMLNGKVDVQLSYVMICMCETLHPMQATLYPDVYIRLRQSRG